MVATVQIREFNTATEGTGTDKTSLTCRFKNADNNTVDTANLMVIPASGDDRSFEKWLALFVSTAGGYATIDTIEFYMDGTAWTGCVLYVRSTPPTTYAQPVEPANDTGFSDTTSVAVTGTRYAVGGSRSTTTGRAGNFVVLMLKVSSTATQGQLTSRTATFSYNET